MNVRHEESEPGLVEPQLGGRELSGPDGPSRGRAGRARPGLWSLGLCLLALASCRESDDDLGPGVTVGLQPSTVGAHGCSGLDQNFTGSCAPCTQALPLGTLVLGPQSQILGSRTAELLYATGLGGQLVEVDLSAPVPVETEILAPGDLDAFLTSIGAALPGALSGICVLPDLDLVVAEHTNNILLRVDLATPVTVTLFAGFPSTLGGFADGPVSQARFSFQAPVSLAATSDSQSIVLVPDPGNHAVRLIQSGNVLTFAGFGVPSFGNGDGIIAGFDTPVSVTLRCSGTAIVTETGAASVAGHRLRQLVIMTDQLVGNIEAQVETLVGDGAPATVEGLGMGSSAFAPLAVMSTSEEDTYWIDSGSGVLRRVAGSDSSTDCPLFSDCATAVGAGGTFTAGGTQSLTETPSGRLFVSDYDPGAGSGTLFEVTP